MLVNPYVHLLNFHIRSFVKQCHICKEWGKCPEHPQSQPHWPAYDEQPQAVIEHPLTRTWVPTHGSWTWKSIDKALCKLESGMGNTALKDKVEPHLMVLLGIILPSSYFCPCRRHILTRQKITFKHYLVYLPSHRQGND